MLGMQLDFECHLYMRFELLGWSLGFGQNFLFTSYEFPHPFVVSIVFFFFSSILLWCMLYVERLMDVELDLFITSIVGEFAVKVYLCARKVLVHLARFLIEGPNPLHGPILFSKLLQQFYSLIMSKNDGFFTYLVYFLKIDTKVV